MKKQDRWNEILSYVNLNKQASVEELADLFHVSPATIRRDLLEMEKVEVLQRYHGGARSNSKTSAEPPMALKVGANQASKNMVGRYAASLIKDNQMVYIDAGSATYEMLDYITAKNISVVTIGIPHINKLVSHGIHTIVLGGSVRENTMAIIGSPVLAQLDNFYFDIAFVGTNGIHQQTGITTVNDMEGMQKEKAISRSKVTYALADHTKFNKIYPHAFAKFDDVWLITDNIGDYEGAPLAKCIEVQKVWNL